MKHSTSKFLKAILCFFALLNANLVFSQSITIHDGTDTNENVPYYFYFSDAVNTTSQFIYPASDLTELKGKNITSIKFYNAGYQKDWSANLVVSLYEGDHTTIEGYTDDPFSDAYITADFTEVFNGNVTVSASSEPDVLEFIFNQPFAYTGKNLIVEIKNSTAGPWQTVNFYGENTSANNAVYGYNGSAQGFKQFLPKATFTYELSKEDLPEYGAKISANAIDFKTVFTNKNKVEEIKITNTGKTDLVASITSIEAPFSIESTSLNIASCESAVLPITFAPTAEGDYSKSITIDLGEAGSYEVALLGNAMDAPIGYIQEFDVENKTLPQGWTGWNIKETYDYSVSDYIFESAEAHTDLFVSTKIDETKAVTIKDNTNPYREYPSQVKVYMVSPLVCGNILISARGTNSSEWTTPEVSAYKANINETEAYTIEETPISINWQSSLSNSEWSYGKFFVEEPCQIALFMHYGAISLFASDAEGDEATGISNIATDNNTKCILNGEMLTISSESNLNSYQIFNINGATIATGDIIGNAIQIQLNAPAGIYFISVNGENGTSIHRTIKK